MKFSNKATVWVPHDLVLKSIAILFLVSLSHCLTMFGGDAQTLTLASHPDGVRVELLADGKRVAETTSPGEIEVPRKAYLVLRFSKSGYHSESIVLRPTFSVGRLFMACLLSIPSLSMGYYIDILNGATDSHDPNHFEITLQPLDKLSQNPPLRIVLLADGQTLTYRTEF